MTLSIAICRALWRPLIRLTFAALLIPLGASSLNGRFAPISSASHPRTVLRERGLDTEAPFVQINPQGIVHSSSVSVFISYCDDSTLNASSRSVTKDGSA